jgi:2-C-methyl-D-erythritol 4-phosphate cytidylyltransferase/2-C-methyl-D-erythritol 2,4-cyclodiphosphate synthase
VTREKTIAVVIVAAGNGSRASIDAGSVPKQYRKIGGKAVLALTVEAMLGSNAVRWLLPVISAEHGAHYEALGLEDQRLLPPVNGGTHRQASVLAGLQALAAHKPDLVLIHDAARPFIEAQTIDAVVAALASHEAALPALPVTDTIKRSADGATVQATEDRHTLFAAQTPQGFRFPQILSAHMRAARLPREFTDDAAIAEWAGLTVALTPGSTANFKLTHPEDFARAARLAGEGSEMETRTGSGYDVHAFEEGDAVWLGGVKIPHGRKLMGHSDADAALHALTDALYGALSEGDIGQRFPPDDPQWRGAASAIFLEHAALLVGERGGRIVNLDVTIICEAPRIGPHVEAMRQAIAGTCRIAPGRVAIKATTNERLGFLGREEGIAAMATATIELPRVD